MSGEPAAVTGVAERVPAPVLVLAGIVSVQFGGALAQTLIPVIGAGGSVVLRLLFATAMLLVLVRPRWRGHSRRAWLTGRQGWSLVVVRAANIHGRDQDVHARLRRGHQDATARYPV